MTLGVTGKLILAFVTLLLGSVLIGVIATQELAVTDKKVITNETEAFSVNAAGDSPNVSDIHTVTNPPTTWRVVDCPLTSVAIKNATDTLTVDTDYTFTLNSGTWTFINTSTTQGLIGADNNTQVDYTYCGDDYLNLSWSRTIVNLIGGFFAIAILLASVGLFYSVAKDTGIA